MHRKFQRGHARSQNLDNDTWGNHEEMDAFMRESRSNDRMSERHINFHKDQYEPPSLRPTYSTPTRNEQAEKNSESKSGIKSQNYDDSEHFDTYMTQFNLIAELNSWSYKTKSLYLASCLVGMTKASLNELSEDTLKV